MVNVCLVAGNICDEESSRLLDFFDQVKLLTSFWQTGEYQKEGVLDAVRDLRPNRCDRNILGMKELGSCPAYRVDEKGSFPDPDEHVRPLIPEVTMNVYERIIQSGCVDFRQDFRMNFRLQCLRNEVIGYATRLIKNGIHNAGFKLKFTQYFGKKPAERDTSVRPAKATV